MIKVRPLGEPEMRRLGFPQGKKVGQIYDDGGSQVQLEWALIELGVHTSHAKVTDNVPQSLLWGKALRKARDTYTFVGTNATERDFRRIRRRLGYEEAPV